jgi:DNA adenine methylase
LPDIVQRLKQVQIENKPAIDLIRKYDRPETLFYCDPPYMAETRTSSNDYAHEMNTQQQIELAEVLNSARGRVALSGYDSPTMAELYPTEKWWKTGFKPRRVPMSSSGKLRRQEVLWTNYDPKTLYGQTTIFQ